MLIVLVCIHNLDSVLRDNVCLFLLFDLGQYLVCGLKYIVKILLTIILY